MSETRYDGLPEVLKNVRTRPLFVMHLQVRPLVVVGATPGADRRIGLVPGGSFEGERLSGQVMDGGSDWQAVRADGSTTVDVRLVLKTKDDSLIAMTYRGVRHGPADVIKRMEKGEAVDPSSYYFRINPMFETAAATYDWLNRVLAVGIGHRRPDGTRLQCVRSAVDRKGRFPNAARSDGSSLDIEPARPDRRLPMGNAGRRPKLFT